jgi:hypothetical protein
MRRALAKENTNSELVCIALSPDQTGRLRTLLERHRKASGVKGLLCGIKQSFSVASGTIRLELQVILINRRIAALLNRAARQAAAADQVK